MLGFSGNLLTVYKSALLKSSGLRMFVNREVWAMRCLLQRARCLRFRVAYTDFKFVAANVTEKNFDGLTALAVGFMVVFKATL